MKRIVTTLMFPVILFLIALVVLCIIFSNIDFSRVEHKKAPIFTFIREEIKDGGTVIYTGVFYQIISWHRLPPDHVSLVGYEVGNELLYFPNLHISYFNGKLKPKIKLEYSPD